MLPRRSTALTANVEHRFLAPEQRIKRFAFGKPQLLEKNRPNIKELPCNLIALPHIEETRSEEQQ
jgi:hypothetical protein